jgi:hypothetical protein
MNLEALHAVAAGFVLVEKRKLGLKMFILSSVEHGRRGVEAESGKWF